MKAWLILLLLAMTLWSGVIFAEEATPAASPTATRAGSSLTTAESPPAFLRPPAPRKPIPLRWKIAIVAAVLVVSGALLALAARAWHSWNLFDRQYRFSPATAPDRRLGANRSGGCMATLQFGRGSPAEDR